MDERLAKKVNEYFKFMQDILQKQYGKKTPLDIKDKKERKEFFEQVKDLWSKRKK